MPIVSAIGRRHWKVRLLVWGIFASLAAGSVTMLYPFALMLAGSTKSAVDSPDAKIVPPFLVSDLALWRKHAEAHFNESQDMMKTAYRSEAPSFRELLEPKPNPALADAWRTFCERTPLPFYAYMVGEVDAPRSRGVMPQRLRVFKRLLAERFGDDLGRLNQELGTAFTSWNAITYQPEEYLLRRNKPSMLPFDQAFRDFKAKQPLDSRYYFSPEGYFRMAFLQSRYGKDIAHYNQTHGTAHAGWDAVHLSRQAPAAPSAERQDWEEFVRGVLNLYWVRVDAAAAPQYHNYLRDKYTTLDALNHIQGASHKSWDSIPLVDEPPPSGVVQADWDAWLQGWRSPDGKTFHQAPLEALRVHGVDFLFRDFLAAQYQSVAAANQALGTSHSTWMDFLPPQAEFHHEAFLRQTGELRREFATRNFVAVANHIVLHGRAVLNTVVYCLLAILAALVVNPLAAYALSRYRPPSQYKVLLFLMLTMAFPPMVTQIPAFLMLRELGMLNTYWALILPGLANGYSIFLLKGFFDSLPRELYESAAIDGAGEVRIFLQITMSLSTPILAVIALGAFTGAYGNFMMALLVCQDQKMWTIMPWLYQLQQSSSEGVVFASLLLVAAPTLLVFVFCQNVIMRGIVVPVEK